MLVTESRDGVTDMLRSVTESLRSESLAELPDARVEDDFSSLHEAVEALEAERLRRLAEIDRRRIYARNGHLSAVSWLAGRFTIGWGEARRAVSLGRGLAQMTDARRAFEAGTVSLSALRVLAQAREVEPEAFSVAEPFLVQAASRHTIADLHRAVVRWRQAVEAERAGREGWASVLRARRRLHASVTLEGMVRLDGDLDPEAGETFMTALRAVLDTDARSGGARDLEADDRTPTQRRADALGEICRGWLDRADRAEVAGERPHLSVMVPFEALGARGDGELEHIGSVDHETVRRLSCDASVTRVVMGPRSEPLDVGRRTPVVSTAIRRAVIARDRQCRFPGCDRPQSWCDAHHVTHWADGGETALTNLVLLCRRHHTMVHTGFSLEMVRGRPVFRRADGSVLEDRTRANEVDREPP